MKNNVLKLSEQAAPLLGFRRPGVQSLVANPLSLVPGDKSPALGSKVQATRGVLRTTGFGRRVADNQAPTTGDKEPAIIATPQAPRTVPKITDFRRPPEAPARPAQPSAPAGYVTEPVPKAKPAPLPNMLAPSPKPARKITLPPDFHDDVMPLQPIAPRKAPTAPATPSAPPAPSPETTTVSPGQPEPVVTPGLVTTALPTTASRETTEDSLSGSHVTYKVEGRNGARNSNFTKMSVYKGVTRAVRCESRPWRAQCAAAGKNYHLGNFETEEDAARAYDNVLHYLRDFGFSQTGQFNFPGEYQANPPPMTDTTRRVIFDCAGRQGTRDPQQLPKSVARCLPLLRQIAAAVPELEEALAGLPAAQSVATENQDGPQPTVASKE